MAIDVFAKRWGVIPPVSARAVQGHSLCPRHGFVFDGAIVDLVRNVRGTFNAGAWPSGGARRYVGKTRQHTATTDADPLGLDGLLLPTSGCTIVVGQEKTDATNRSSVSFGNETTTTAQFCAAYIPYTDGVVYWDFGGEVGAARVSASGLTFGDDVWVFTVGPREQAIYQNGVSRVSAAQNPSRSQGSVNFQLGRHKAGALASDLVKYKFFWIYHRQLTEREITEISVKPFCWVDPRP